MATEKRYYYKKDGKPAYNLKEPLENILNDVTGYVEITKEEWDELTYVAPHTPTDEELAAQAEAERKAPILAEIAAVKAELAKTDYKCLKYVDGALTEQEYAETRTYRQTLRDRINELESEL